MNQKPGASPGRTGDSSEAQARVIRSEVGPRRPLHRPSQRCVSGSPTVLRQLLMPPPHGGPPAPEHTPYGAPRFSGRPCPQSPLSHPQLQGHELNAGHTVSSGARGPPASLTPCPSAWHGARPQGASAMRGWMNGTPAIGSPAEGQQGAPAHPWSSRSCLDQEARVARGLQPRTGTGARNVGSGSQPPCPGSDPVRPGRG